MKYSIDKIADIVDGSLVHASGDFICQIITDSRRIYQPEGSLYVALRGPNHDGHDYIPELHEKGVRNFIVEESYDRNKLEQGSYIIVHDTLKALQKLAAHHRKSFHGELIAITGSNGKTVVKEWLSQLLSNLYSVSKSPKSFNSQVGVPLSVLMMENGPDFHILEAGISQSGEMLNLEAILEPDEGIITNIGDAHQKNFSSYEEKLKEKLELFKKSKALYYCRDNYLIKGLVEGESDNYSRLTYSWSFEQEADLVIRKLEEGRGKILLEGRFKNIESRLEIPFSDPASLENLCHIYLFWLVKGLPLNALQKGILKLEPVAMRLEQKEGLRGCTLINDYYNADLQSLAIAIDLLINQLPQEKKTLILSDIFQTGNTEAELIRSINKLLRDKNLFRVIGIGNLFVNNKGAFEVDIDSYRDTDSFLSGFHLSELRSEAILLKGARKFEFERISKRLEKRVNNTYVEVNMNNILKNLNYFKSQLKSGTKVMAMVKAASYGSGTHEIGKFLAHQRVDYLGVAIADEGIQLREAGIDIPIMVMNPGLDSLDAMIEHKLEPEIFSINGLKQFIKAVNQSGLKKYPIHIKIDSGMHRLGFHEDEIEDMIGIIKNSNLVEVRSAFSHLASSDTEEGDSFTHYQASLFKRLLKRIRQEIQSPFLAHLANTSAISRFPEYHYDMVRLGIGLYGIDPGSGAKLKPVISMRSSISQIHELKKGDAVGYGSSETMTLDGRIAVIPVGYADGIDRRWGNGNGFVLINGKRVPTIGRICMDMCMVNITGLDTSVGDEVSIIGDGIDLQEMADRLGTIPYEVLTRIPQRVKRVFLFE